MSARPCEHSGEMNVNVCVAEGCYGEACVKLKPAERDPQALTDAEREYLRALVIRECSHEGRNGKTWCCSTCHSLALRVLSARPAASTDTAAQRVVEYGLRGADGTIYDGADEGLRWTRVDALRAADVDPEDDQPNVLICRDVVLPPSPIEGPWRDLDPGTRTAHHDTGHHGEGA